jgi:hypothetical protein
MIVLLIIIVIIRLQFMRSSYTVLSITRICLNKVAGRKRARTKTSWTVLKLTYAS